MLSGLTTAALQAQHTVSVAVVSVLALATAALLRHRAAGRFGPAPSCLALCAAPLLVLHPAVLLVAATRRENAAVRQSGACKALLVLATWTGAALLIAASLWNAGVLHRLRAAAGRRLRERRRAGDAYRRRAQQQQQPTTTARKGDDGTTPAEGTAAVALA